VVRRDKTAAMRARLVVGSLLLLIACKSGKASNGAPCEAVGARFLAVAKSDLTAKPLEPDVRRGLEGLLAPMRDGMVRACREAAWTAASRDCFAGAADQAAMKACAATLTDVQRSALDAAAAGAPPPR